jgi:hypothetical protein
MKNRVMTQLTTEMARMWKSGRWKYSYTNLKTKCRGFLAVSGRYFYFIDFVGSPRIVSFEDVPKTYQELTNPDKTIYKIPSQLVRIEKRGKMR